MAWIIDKQGVNNLPQVYGKFGDLFTWREVVAGMESELKNKTYTAPAACANCGSKIQVRVQKGIPIPDIPCPNCLCQKLIPGVTKQK